MNDHLCDQWYAAKRERGEAFTAVYLRYEDDETFVGDTFVRRLWRRFVAR